MGPAVLLKHDFPYDIAGDADVAALLAAGGCRVTVPSLRRVGSIKRVAIS